MFNRTSRLAVSVLLLMLTNILPVMAQSPEKVLIVYFTWAENTTVTDRERSVKEANSHVFGVENRTAVDTVTTASVIAPGNTTRIAEWIREITGGDLFSIRVKDKYSPYWNEILDRASREKARGERPELEERVLNISDYDVVFLGFPTWWYTIPMSVASFVEYHDLSDKIIIPFVSHGTSGKARTIRDLSKLLPPSASLKKEIGIYRSETAGARSSIQKWLEDLGYPD